ncbi:MAG: type II toxin-antitoxin system YoeB family toxin [Saprospiraceae bacterium]
MEIRIGPEAAKDLEYIKSISNKGLFNHIELLLKSIIETPYTGIGKPEPLKHNWSGKWSKPID